MHSIEAKKKELEVDGLLYSYLEALEKALDTTVLGLYWHLFQQVTTELHVTMSAFPLETQSFTNTAWQRRVGCSFHKLHADIYSQLCHRRDSVLSILQRASSEQQQSIVF